MWVGFGSRLAQCRPTLNCHTQFGTQTGRQRRSFGGDDGDGKTKVRFSSTAVNERGRAIRRHDREGGGI